MEGKTLELPEDWEGLGKFGRSLAGGYKREGVIREMAENCYRRLKTKESVQSYGKSGQTRGEGEEGYRTGSSWGVRESENRQSLETWMLQLLRYKPGGCQRTEPSEDTTTLMSRAMSKFPSLLQERDPFLWDLDLSSGHPPQPHLITAPPRAPRLWKDSTCSLAPHQGATRIQR